MKSKVAFHEHIMIGQPKMSQKNLKLALLLLQFEMNTIYLVDSNKNPLTILTFLDQLGLSHPTYY